MRRLVGVVALLALAGCSQQVAERQDAVAPSRSTGGQQQAWGKPSSATTCGDFQHRMSSPQRSVMVTELLTDLRRERGHLGPPARVVVDGFEAAMHHSCAAVPGSYGVSDVAVGVYLTERAHWRG